MSLALWSAIDRQWRSRLRSRAYLVGATLPVLLISVLLYQTAVATKSPATAMFLAILSALWIGGSSCVREIVDERRLVAREPHLNLVAYGLAKIVHAVALASLQASIVTLFLSLTGIVRLPFPHLWLIVVLVTLAGSLLAMILSALCNEASTALAWFPLLLVPQVVFGGFLFPYGTTRPFDLNRATSVVTVMPQPLIRPKVTNVALRVAGALCVSRWALEAYAAEVFEQDLDDDDRLEEAVLVSFFMPLTLTERQASDQLLDHLTETPGAERRTPRIAARRWAYRGILAGFVMAEAVLLLVILPIRDPRRL
jgi:hypothetical protein